MTRVLKEVHSGDEHQDGSRLFKQLIHLGYYWATMEANAASFAQMCQACQLNSNKIYASIVDYTVYLHLGHSILVLLT